MLQLKNTTPFSATLSVFPDEHAIDTLYIIVKATVSIGKRLEIAEKQLPVILADEYWGEPGTSSIKYASEILLTKPSTDIVLIGDVCTPDKQQVVEADVLLSVGKQCKLITVFGDRVWEFGAAGVKMTAPELFETMPLRYENAFGGTHMIDPETMQFLSEERNPVGRGFKGKKDRDELHGMALPNLEDPEHLITKPSDSPPPACFGYVAPSWEPRKAFAGTYDETWLKNRAPYLPEDFDARYFNTAHPDLTCDNYLRGGEPVAICNMSPEGQLQFTLPEWEFEIGACIAGKTEHLAPHLETVLFEPSDQRFSMLWRASVACDKKTLKIENVDINLKRFQMYDGEVYAG